MPKYNEMKIRQSKFTHIRHMETKSLAVAAARIIGKTHSANPVQLMLAFKF